LRAVLAAAPLSPPLFSFCPLILAFSPRGGRREQKSQRERRKRNRGKKGDKAEGEKAPSSPQEEAPRVKASLPRGERKSKVFRFKLVSPAVRTLNSSRFLKNLFSGRAVFSSDLAERAFPSSPLSPRGRGLG